MVTEIMFGVIGFCSLLFLIVCLIIFTGSSSPPEPKGMDVEVKSPGITEVNCDNCGGKFEEHKTHKVTSGMSKRPIEHDLRSPMYYCIFCVPNYDHVMHVGYGQGDRYFQWTEVTKEGKELKGKSK